MKIDADRGACLIAHGAAPMHILKSGRSYLTVNALAMRLQKMHISLRPGPFMISWHTYRRPCGIPGRYENSEVELAETTRALLDAVSRSNPSRVVRAAQPNIGLKRRSFRKPGE